MILTAAVPFHSPRPLAAIKLAIITTANICESVTSSCSIHSYIYYIIYISCGVFFSYIFFKMNLYEFALLNLASLIRETESRIKRSVTFMGAATRRGSSAFAVNSRRLELHKHRPASGQMSVISRTTGLDYRRSLYGRGSLWRVLQLRANLNRRRASPAVNNCWPHISHSHPWHMYFTSGACKSSIARPVIPRKSAFTRSRRATIIISLARTWRLFSRAANTQYDEIINAGPNNFIVFCVPAVYASRILPLL